MSFKCQGSTAPALVLRIILTKIIFVFYSSAPSLKNTRNRPGNEKIIWETYVKGTLFAKLIFTTFLIVSATRRRRDSVCCVCWPPCKKVWYSKLWPWTHVKAKFFGIPISANLVKEIKIVSLRWNLEASPSRICRIQLWSEIFLFWAKNTLFGKIWSQNSKLFKVI